MNNSSRDNISTAIREKNTLLISTVINCILEKLPLGDLKNARLICREWNSHSEPHLRKKANILFTPDFRTTDFFEYYSESRLSALPFTAFTFTNYLERDLGFLVADLDYFFTKCGRNIKSLVLNYINIWRDKDHQNRITAMNIDHWLDLLSDEVDKLKIEVNDVNDLSTRFSFNLENLVRVKSLSLSRCDVIVNSSNLNQISPSKISLQTVTFLNQSENKLTNINVNDFVDFRKCSKIELVHNGWSNTTISFDPSKDIITAKRVEFWDIQLLNSGFSKIKTDFLSVNLNPSEAIKMQMKHLDINECTSVNLTYLPQTVEKLKIRRSLCVPEVTAPLNLPNLKYLHLEPPTRANENHLRAFEILSWFKNCSNLVDVHLEGSGMKGCKIELDVAWIPKTVKRLKVTGIPEIVVLADLHPIHVDVLLLDASINSLAVEMLMGKIIPKILVKQVTFDMESVCPVWSGKEETEDFISFVKKNTQLEKIVIGMLYTGLEKVSSSAKKSFLQFVGEESLCYEFNNQIAKAISEDEFDNYYDLI